MSRVPREYGKTIRRIEVTKLRGSAFREGFHDYIIRSGGIMRRGEWLEEEESIQFRFCS